MLFDVHMTNKERKWNETTTQDTSFLCNHTFVSLSHVNRQGQKQKKHKKDEEKQKIQHKKKKFNKEDRSQQRKPNNEKSKEKKNPTKIFSLA